MFTYYVIEFICKVTEVKIGSSKPAVANKDRLKRSVVSQKKSNPELLLPGNQRSNKAQRLLMKKAKKDHARRGNSLLNTFYYK